MKGRLAAGALMIAALTGCSTPHITPTASKFPTPSGPIPSRSLPPVTHTWDAAAVKCPTLTDVTAQNWGIGGTATQTAARGSDDLVRIVECRWGPDDESATSITAKLSVSANQPGADAGWQVISNALVKPEPLTGIGEEAFVSQPLDLRGVQIDIRTGNANINIRLRPATGNTDGNTQLRQAAAAIAADTIDELVPA